MRKWGSAAAMTALLVALTVPAAAEANKIAHRGSIVGVPSAKVKFKVKKKQGDLRSVSNLRFKQIPVQCDDGASGFITAEIPNFPLSGKKFTRKGPIRGPGVSNGTLRAFGKFRRGGRVARGNVKIAFKASSGVGCGTNRLKWKTT